ncbi:alpha/beta hydrolase family protein [Rhodococcus sp. MEB064]|uniref:alpha/beta hydrolase family protein n=1 Tax=Rhodococcus sp. MEB064 TaxID=1587522 RepID=UPI0005ABE447|nr:lipase family protein [Rhodococcus sp. MEB064]KIQ16593.1 lipase [Rhodococcus sp. MEB064]
MTSLRRLGLPALVACVSLATPLWLAVAPASAEPAAGTVISSSALDPALAPRGAAESYLVRYTTLRTADKVGESTGTVFVPAGEPPVGGWPVVSHAHGTTGIDDACAPSLTGTTELERPAVEAWLAAGYAVVATDYAGMRTPGVSAYLDGPAAGANTVDIVRAAHSVVGGTLSPTWIATGLSQGGNAAYFAAAAASSRAPELDFRGAVAIAGPTQLDSVFPFAGPTIPPVLPNGIVGYVFSTLAGMSDQRPELDVRSYLTPRGLEYLNAATTLCGTEFRTYRETHPAQFGDLLTRPLTPLAPVFRQMQAVPVSGYDRPLLVTQSLADQTVPAPLTFAQTARMSAAGTDFQLVTFPTPDHVGTLMASMPASLDFAARVLR